jgi:hypothetical protein
MSFSLILSNLLNPPVLFFFLGMLAGDDSVGFAVFLPERDLG